MCVYNAVIPHYLRVLNLRILLLAQIYLSPPNQYSWRFHSNLQTCSKWWKCTCFQLRPNEVTLPSRFSSHTTSKCCFHGLFSAYFFFFNLGAVCWWFHCLKCPPGMLLKSLNSRKWQCVLYGESMCVLDELLQAWVHSAGCCELGAKEPTTYII